VVNLALLALRLTLGGLMAGHGAQKLFGSFGGPGPKGTAGMMEAIGLKPGHRWGAAAALSEFGGGVLTALGLFNPLGPLSIMGSMSMATATVHWGKPIWATAGGAELPVTNMAIASALAAAGPGRYSLDRAFGIRLPGVIVAGTLISAAALLGLGLAGRSAGASAQPAQEQAGAEAPAGQKQAGAEAPAGQEATVS